MTKITMTFDATGGVTTAVHGVRGRKCTDLTAFLDKEFGTGERHLTAEFHAHEGVRTNHITSHSQGES